MPIQLITLAEAAEQLAVSERTVRRAISAGRLPAFSIGRSIRVRAQDLEKVLRPVPPSAT